MIIVKVMGGLGNQLFQYALYRQFQENGREAYLDVSWYYMNRGADRKYQLDIFNTKILECSQKQKYALANNDKNIFGVAWHRLFGNRGSHIVEIDLGRFNPAILKLQNGYLDGYWQSEGYFKGIAGLLWEEVTLKNAFDKKNENMLGDIERTNSVAIHVRRGDYLKVHEMYGGICTENYYNSGMEYMERHIGNAHYFVFSDDMYWCREFFGSRNNVTYVDINDENTGHCDLMLMSKCRNIIIANSSFSWWAAWLNRNKEKIVVAPDRWTNDNACMHIVPESWIRISGKKGMVT